MRAETLEATKPALTPVVLCRRRGRGVDEDQACHPVGMAPRVDPGDETAEAVADEHDRLAAGCVLDHGVELAILVVAAATGSIAAWVWTILFATSMALAAHAAVVFAPSPSSAAPPENRRTQWE
jgi:hypothetical protein